VGGKAVGNGKAAISYNPNDGVGSSGIRIVENCVGEKLESYVQEAKEVFGSYGLVVLRANDIADSLQHGWSDLYFPLKNLHVERRYKAIQGIRGCRGRESRLWLFEHNVIDEGDIYAWFYDLVWRQNNQAVVLNTSEGKKSFESFHGRWNKKRPWGYQVRKRLGGVLESIENPLLLTLSLSDKLIYRLMPVNTNLDVVSFAIKEVGGWVRLFRKRLFMYQQRRSIDWQFKGWVIEFQEQNNRGFPHVHMIFAGNWMGRINEIQSLWPYGRADLTTKKDVQRRFPGRSVEGVRLANYLTKYVSKAGSAITENGIHKGYAWLAFTGGRVFAIKHERKGGDNDGGQELQFQ